MADFIWVADRMYEGASTDTKPSSGIPNGSLAKETDTLMTYITYDHGATWIVRGPIASGAEIIRFPFGKGDLTSNGIQYSTLVTTSDGTWTEVEAATIEPDVGGEIAEVQLSLTGSFQSSSTSKDVLFKWQARNKDGTWVDLHSAVTYAANASTLVEYTYSGTFVPVTNFNEVPFDIRLVIQREDSGENAKGKTKSSSWIKVKYQR